MTGYLHPAYAESLRQFGVPRRLPASAGWVIERPIPDAAHRDAMGCYPLFTCENWSALESDVPELGQDLVCLSLVTDPFGRYEPAGLKRLFPDVCIPFKEHFVVDLSRPPGSFVSAHHRRNVARAARAVEVERCEEPARHGADWVALYASLRARHRIAGLSAFSPAALEAQLEVPGLVMFRAVSRGETAGITLWYIHRDVAWYHLGACSDGGYRLRASFALFACAIEWFSTRLRWLDLGAGAGLRESNGGGLSRFKRGWSTGTRRAYFCGRIFDSARYADIVRRKRTAGTSYFPEYRADEHA